MTTSLIHLQPVERSESRILRIKRAQVRSNNKKRRQRTDGPSNLTFMLIGVGVLLVVAVAVLIYNT